MWGSFGNARLCGLRVRATWQSVSCVSSAICAFSSHGAVAVRRRGRQKVAACSLGLTALPGHKRTTIGPPARGGTQHRQRPFPRVAATTAIGGRLPTRPLPRCAAAAAGSIVGRHRGATCVALARRLREALRKDEHLAERRPNAARRLGRLRQLVLGAHLLQVQLCRRRRPGTWARWRRLLSLGAQDCKGG